MELNYTLITIATIVQFIVGAIWFTAIFGKAWGKIMGVDCTSPEAMKEASKGMGKFMVLQLILTFITTTVTAVFINLLPEYSAYMIAFWLWVGFLLPIHVSGAIWGNTKRQFWLKQISISVVGYFIEFMLAAWILSM